MSRQFEISTSLIYKWRREVLAAQTEGQFVPAVIVDGQQDVECAARSEPAIVVELAGGARVTVSARCSLPGALPVRILKTKRG